MINILVPSGREINGLLIIELLNIIIQTTTSSILLSVLPPSRIFGPEIRAFPEALKQDININFYLCFILGHSVRLWSVHNPLYFFVTHTGSEQVLEESHLKGYFNRIDQLRIPGYNFYGGNLFYVKANFRSDITNMFKLTTYTHEHKTIQNLHWKCPLHVTRTIRRGGHHRAGKYMVN